MVPHQSPTNKLLKDLEQLGLGDLPIAVLIDGHDELCDLLCSYFLAPAEGLEGVGDETEDFLLFEGAAVVGVVLGEDGVDGLFQLLVGGFGGH